MSLIHEHGKVFNLYESYFSSLINDLEFLVDRFFTSLVMDLILSILFFLQLV